MTVITVCMQWNILIVQLYEDRFQNRNTITKTAATSQLIRVSKVQGPSLKANMSIRVWEGRIELFPEGKIRKQGPNIMALSANAAMMKTKCQH
jgi:hypothetical protein